MPLEMVAQQALQRVPVSQAAAAPGTFSAHLLRPFLHHRVGRDP